MFLTALWDNYAHLRFAFRDHAVCRSFFIPTKGLHSAFQKSEITRKVNENYNNISKRKIGCVYFSAQRGFLDVFEEAWSLLFTGQKIAVFKGHFLPAFHGGRNFNIRIAKIFWLLCGYRIFFRLCTTKK